jgi:hypothetical protein
LNFQNRNRLESETHNLGLSWFHNLGLGKTGLRQQLGFRLQSPNLIRTPTQSPPPPSWSPPANRAAGAGEEDGEPHGPAREEHSRDEPAESDREDRALKNLPEHLLEGAVLRAHRGDAGRQGHGARPYRRQLRRESQANSVPLPRTQDAADPARQGHCRRVHQERGLQVSSIYVPY